MEPFIGQIQLFAFNWAPQGWLTCQGQILSIAQNTALFSLLGTTFGGDGVTNFALPNFGGRAPIGQGQSPGTGQYQMGQLGGNENVTLLQTQMPAHTHAVAPGSTATATATSTLNAANTAGDSPRPGAKMPAVLTGENMYVSNPDPSTLVTMDPKCVSTTVNVTAVNVTLSPAGGSQPVNVQAPYVAMNYSIAIQGIYPSRP